MALKILQIFTILNRGGAETNMMNYYREMDRSRFQCDFLVHRPEEGAYEKEILELGGKIFRLPALHPLKIDAYKKAVALFFDENPGYQIIHGQLSELGVFIYEEAKKRKIPVIIAHAHNSPKLRDYDAKFLFREIWKKRMRKSVNTYFTCGGDSAKWLFGKNLAAKAYQMNNAVNTADFAFDQVLRKTKKIELSADKKLNFFHVGRFHKQKNHHFLIELFSEFIKLQPGSHLYLVGEGSLKASVQKRVNKINLGKQVTFLGLRDDVAELFQAMDVFLFPSLFEGLPVALVEAQASGIFCAISDAIPSEAILVDENVLVQSLERSPEDWAQAVLVNYADFERKDVSAEIISAGYDIKANANKLEEKYLQLVKQFT